MDSDIVKDHMDENVVRLSVNTPLLEAIHSVYKHDFIIVVGDDKAACGIVTVSDISSQFLSWTQPFLWLEEIENQIRRMMDGRFLLEDLQKMSREAERQVESIDDLTLGEYIRFLQKPDNWKMLGMDAVDRKYFLAQLDKVREARNDVMHFDPAGLSCEQCTTLYNMCSFLRKINEGR